MPIFKDLINYNLNKNDLEALSDGLQNGMLFAAGAKYIYPSIRNFDDMKKQI